jgi:hypothetical protein
MEGRYGNDKLNMSLLRTSLIIMLVDLFLPGGLVKLILWVFSYGLAILAILRALSRNIYKRYEENRKYLQFFDQLKDRQNRYFDCPKCRQRVRVPRGKGKISITCPRCRERFIRKT